MKNQLTREFQLTLKQYINERIPITVIFGDLKSECTIIQGADIVINNDEQTELVLTLVRLFYILMIQEILSSYLL